MRDIVNSNGFNASNQQTKNKVTKMTNPSGTLTKTDYRSYRDFLGSYGDKNSRDDQESVSSNESGISSSNLSESKSNNTSTSSLNSEINLPNAGVANRTGSFRNYLESYNNKKFSSVKPAPPPKQNIKSEIVIQINNPSTPQNFVTTDTIDACPPLPNPLPPKMLNGHQRSNGSKGFSYLPPPPPQIQTKNLDEGECFPPPPSPIINGDECAFPPPPPPIQFNINNGGGALPPPPPPPLPNQANFKNSGGKKWNAVEVDEHGSKKVNPNEKIPSNPAAANLAKILKQHLLPRKLELERQLNEEVSKPNGVEKKPQGENYKCAISFNVAPPSSRFPTSPPPKIDYCTLPRRSPKLPQFENHKLPPRSPPPKFENHKLPPKIPSTNGSVDFNTTTVVPINDAATKVSKNDPNVRKLVYNTYRGLLGAYNNKANDMIATLPRSRVREDQGVSKQLESIALQGGLEKLNGRINPNIEQDEVHNQ